jgi:glycosyltransferase involved in cell wall biosynthesis
MSASHSAAIIIPTFNRAGMLGRAIDTALGQSVPCEVIVCDHGSTDDTPQIAASYKDRIKYLRRVEDHGPFFAWLDGLINATSELVHLTFDDDWLDPTFIEECLTLFRADCAFVLTSAEVHVHDGRRIPLLRDMFATGIHSARKIEAHLLAMHGTISPGCAVFRKKDVLPAMRIGGLPNQRSTYHGVGNDLLMFLLPLLSYRKFGFVNRPLAHFFGHPGSITSDAETNPDKLAALYKAYDEAKRYYLGLKLARRLPVAAGLWGYERLKQKLSKPIVALATRRRRR